jgi:hypothetical protein
LKTWIPAFAGMTDALVAPADAGAQSVILDSGPGLKMSGVTTFRRNDGGAGMTDAGMIVRVRIAGRAVYRKGSLP